MKVGDLVRSTKFPKLEGIVTDVLSYHGIIKIRTKRNTEYSFSADHLEIVVESR